MSNVAEHQASNTDEQDLSASAPVISPGQLLRSARMNKSFELTRVSEELKIPESKLSALENDDFSKLASPTFVKGYIRAYSRYLDLDVDFVIRAYDNLATETPEHEYVIPQQTMRLEPVERPFPEWRWPIVIGAIILSLVVAYILWGDEIKALIDPSQQAAKSELQVAPTVIDDTVVDSDLIDDITPITNPFEASGESGVIDFSSSDATADGSVGDEFSAETGESSSELLANSTSGEPSTVTSSDLTAQQQHPGDSFRSSLASGSSKLSFVFSQDCWLDVKDADGRTLHVGLKSSGDTLTLTGPAPFAVMLGNARAASLQLNGEPVELTPVPGRNTLRLQVGQ